MNFTLNQITDPAKRERVRRMMELMTSPNPGATNIKPTSARDSDDLESVLHDYILKYAHDRGWLAVHSRMDLPTTTAVGTSDFILVTPRTVYFIEAKRRGGKLTPKQLAFLTAIAVLGWPQAVVHSQEEFLNFMEGRE